MNLVAKPIDMKTLLPALFLIACSLSTLAQQSPRIIVDIPTSQKPWNNIDWNDSKEQFQFAIVTDRTGGHRPGVFLEGMKRLNLLQPEFVMSVGDLIEGYTRDTERLDAEWTEFMGFIDTLQMPFFYVPGNHDITNEVMEKKWEELFGVTYYHFVYKDVLFLCLNSEDNLRGAGRGTIDDEQYEYVKKVLADNQDVKWTLVFLHQPLWVQKDTKRWSDVEKLLADRDHNVFAGHYHRYWKTQKNKGKYIALATTGGGSRLRGPAYGEFDHVVWVTMTEKGPLLANLLLEGIWDEDVVTEDIVKLVRNRPFPVKVEPVYLDNTQLGQVTTSVKITNDSDHKMTVNLEGVAHSSLFYQLEKETLVVEPNDVAAFQLMIKNDHGKDLTSLSPIRIRAEVDYEYEGRPNVVLQNTLSFAPIFKQKVSQSAKKVKVDGNIKEWKGPWITLQEKNMRGKPFNYHGEKDCTIKFSSSYDEEHFYMAFDIKDDDLFVNEKGSFWGQDALIIGLDARPRHVSAMNVGEGRGQEWLVYLQTFKEKDAVYNLDRLPEGVRSAISKNDKGVQVEVAFPVSYLDKMHTKPWTNVRLGVGYYDYDGDGEERTEHYWYPAWNSDENTPGSGMMFKE